MMQEDYYRSHDHLGYIGGSRHSVAAAQGMYIPPAMFNMPLPPPHHYDNQVSSGFFVDVIRVYMDTVVLYVYTKYKSDAHFRTQQIFFLQNSLLTFAAFLE